MALTQSISRLLVRESRRQCLSSSSFTRACSGGGDYYLANSDEFGELVIRRNHNSYTGELNEPDHPDWTIYMSVNEPPDPEALCRRLTAGGLRLLNRAVV